MRVPNTSGGMWLVDAWTLKGGGGAQVGLVLGLGGTVCSVPCRLTY